jgi:hypothetical protein
MKKYIYFMTVMAVILLIPLLARAQMAVEWDAYSDPEATGLRLEQSVDKVNWTTCLDNISTSDTSAVVPTYAQENVRVYYRMVAFNDTDDSEPSNVISFYWTTGGGGHEGLGAPGLIRFIDCNNPVGAGEQQICQDLGL